MNFDLNGKTVLITGAARRIGALIARAAADAGADLIIHSNQSIKDASQLAAEIKDKERVVNLVSSNFSDSEKTEEFARGVFKKFPVDILVNNAAVFENLSFQETTLERWQNHLEVNLTAPFLLSKSFAEELPPEKKGRIVNIVDWRALRPRADHFPYTISKAGLVALTYALAASLAPRIAVNAVAFGAIMPPTDGTKAEKFLSHIPSSRLATPEEVAQTLLFLMAGPEYITGEVIYLDGGRHLF